MGDRGNIVYNDGENNIYFYTHWTGSDLPAIVQRALQKAIDTGREDDVQYLSRIIFCELVKGDFDGTTGYGISTWMGDGGIEIYVNGAKGTVAFNEIIYATFDDFLAVDFRMGE